MVGRPLDGDPPAVVGDERDPVVGPVDAAPTGDRFVEPGEPVDVGRVEHHGLQ
jgi:hypothetical protein